MCAIGHQGSGNALGGGAVMERRGGSPREWRLWCPTFAPRTRKDGQDRLCGANETNRFSSLLLPRGGPPPVDDESKSSGECLAAAVHWEGSAGSFDCALLASLTTLRSG